MSRLFVSVLFILLLAIPLGLDAQIAGRVMDQNSLEGVEGAKVWVAGSGKGALTDEKGQFSIATIADDFPAKIYVEAIGFQRDSAVVTSPSQTLKVELEGITMEEVVITGNLRPSMQSQSPIKVEVLSREFIRQLPGATTLMDVVDYVTGVRQQVNCGVCGTNDIHINGMEGPYTLVLIDGMPIVSALGSVYGLNGIPSSMIERIEIVKGPSSTLYGSDAMGGVINVITRDPMKAPTLSLESQINTHGETNLDFGLSPDFGAVKGLIGGNVYYLGNRIDRNEDNFTDIPLNKRLSLFSKWSMRRPQNRTATFAAKLYAEDRFGGVLQWNPEYRGSDSIYGESIRTLRAEVIGSYQLPIKHHLRLDYSYAYHQQDSWYGNTSFDATQHVGFANLVHLGLWKKHQYLAGLSAKVNHYDDLTPATANPDLVVVPGIFVQDEWMPSARVTVLAGIRSDYHQAHGVILSPRLNLRLKPSQFQTLRLTAGTGFRNVNIFTEEHAALTGARQVVITDDLKPERSFNVNLNYNLTFNIGESACNLDLDVFHTYFQNRILPDYDADPNLIVYQNLSGNARVAGVSGKFGQSFTFPLRLEAGLTLLRAWTQDPNGVVEIQEFVPGAEAVYSASYKLRKWKLTFDLNGRVTGPMELPAYAPPYQRPTRSPWFSMHNAQVTKQFGNSFHVFCGVRNLFNYTQPSPLINPAAPFSDTFDTAYAYGPLQGRRFVLGLRLILEDSPVKNAR